MSTQKRKNHIVIKIYKFGIDLKLIHRLNSGGGKDD